MKLSSITPEENLVTLLTGQILVGKAHTQVPVFRGGDVPTTNNAEDFIIVEQNGNTRSFTTTVDVLSGYLMVTYYTKLNANGTIRYTRVNKILDQMETTCSNKYDAKFFFELDRNNLVTNPTANQGIGYSVMRVNVHWHTK